MRLTQEPIYVSPDFNSGTTIEGGVSTIANIPTSTPIIVGTNPNLITNEYGQTIVNQDIPTPINPTPLTPRQSSQQLAQELVDAIKDVASTTTPTPKPTATPTTTPTPTSSATTTPTKDLQTIVQDLKEAQNPALKSSKKPNMKYLLYGGGALALGFIAYKLIKK